MIFFKLCYPHGSITRNPLIGSPTFRLLKLANRLKLALLIIIVNGFTVSAMLNAQPITLNLKDATLETAFNEIKKQTGYGFWYDKAELDDNFKISFQIKGGTLKETLDRCFMDLPFTYEIFDKTIVVKRKTKKLPERVKASINDHIIKGKVTDEKGLPLQGVTIRIKSTEKIAVTNSDGEFSIQVPNENTILQFNYLGYEPFEQRVKANEILNVKLKERTANLEEVAVVSTGYQSIPKERATGSFVLIDSALLNRRVGTNILDRIDGVTSGLIFNKGIVDGSNKSDITIRGRSTIFANPNPLIVLDNFPYDGDLGNINPNDIETITVLKDAAAASIWGVRAGNGVIVLTTRKGKKNNKPILSFNTNLTMADKPDLWYPYQMTSSEYIELEKFLFDKGNYNNTLLNNFGVVSPAVALMDQLKRNQITTEKYNQEISKLQQHDVRDDLDKYFYRNPFNQQYNLNISGGNANQKYYLSGGADRNNNNQVGNNYNRYSLNANNTFNFLKDKFELFTGITLTKVKIENIQINGVFTPYTPYDQFADENGNALAVVNGSTLRASYVDALGTDKLLDWHYMPLNEREPNNISNSINYRLLTGISYKVLSSLKASFNYQYEEGNTERNRNNSKNSFYTRDIINRFTSIAPGTGVVSRIIPVNDIVSRSQSKYSSEYARIQFSFEKKIKEKNELNAIAGYEFKDYSSDNSGQDYYGYDPVTKTNINASINPLMNYPVFYNSSTTQRIATAPSQSGSIDRAISYYANASYTYNQKYIVSLSARKDETNIFGVKSNQKGVPLWSAGLSWNISRESFYDFTAFTELKLRGTFGYNGNADKTISAYLTSAFAGLTAINTSYSQVINPPNPSLRWEKVQNINFGLDFVTKNNWLSGSVDYYVKNGQDLIGESPIAPQTGIVNFRGNSANTKTQGLDLVANVNILSNGHLTWKANVLYSYSKDKVTEYKRLPANNGDLVFSNYSNPIVGYPYNSIFAYQYTGLDGSGNPVGYLNGELSTNYTAINTSFNRDDITFVGSAIPTSFGSIRNTFSFKQWSASFNITYKLGYVFRRSNVFYGDSYGYAQADYDLRWKVPGDELVTRIPSLVYPASGFRGSLFNGSGDLIEKGDHIRMQDIKVNYKLTKKTVSHLPFNSLEIYSYINNIGILWRANRRGIDPDAVTQLIPAARSFSLGINATF